MLKKEGVGASGLSHLSKQELKNYQGKCLGIVNGKVKFVNRVATKVLEQLKEVESEDKIFTCVPKSNITLVK